MKKFLSVFAVAAMVGLSACAGDEETTVIEEGAIEEPAPAPVVTPPMPMDTMTMDSVAADSAR